MRQIQLDTLIIHDSDDDIDYIVGDRDIQGLEYPNIRTSIYDKAGANGQVLSNAFYGGRVVSFPVTIKGADVGTYLENRQNLISALSITRTDNVATTKTARFQDDDGNNYYIEYIVGSLSLPQQYNTLVNGVVILQCPEPALLSGQGSRSISLSSGGGFDSPFDSPFDVDAQVGGEANVYNYGDIDYYPIVTLKGSLVSPTITNVTTGNYIQLNSVNLGVSETITIDMKNRTIKKSNQNYFNYKTVGSSFWSLAPGSNTIKLIDTIYDGNAMATISYYSAYLGI
jgi:phage-related protein